MIEKNEDSRRKPDRISDLQTTDTVRRVSDDLRIDLRKQVHEPDVIVERHDGKTGTEKNHDPDERTL